MRDALASTVPPAGLDGLRRRTRVAVGRCQGTRCAAAVRALCAARPPTAPPSPAPCRRPGARTPSGRSSGAWTCWWSARARPASPPRARSPRPVGRVEALEQQPLAGGVLRYAPWACGAWLDPRAPRRGPAGRDAARRLLDAATGAGALVRTGWTVTGWAGPLTVGGPPGPAGAS